MTPRQVEVIAAELRPRGWHVWAAGGFCYAAGPGYSPGDSQTIWATNLAVLMEKVREASKPARSVTVSVQKVHQAKSFT